MSFLFSILAILAALTTGFLEWLGVVKSFFWFYPWFDIPVHLAGGLTIGLWGSAVVWPRNYNRYQAFFFIILLAIAIGSVWEIFEFVSGLTRGEAGYWADTLKDIGDDILGASVAWGFYSLFRRKKSLPK